MERLKYATVRDLVSEEVAAIEPPAQQLGLKKSPIIKALRLLGYLAQSRQPVALAEMSRALRLPKATGHRLAQTLEGAGFVQKDPLTLRYSVGHGFEAVALGALRNGAGSNARRLLMDDLSARLGVRTNFAVLKAGKLILVEWVESSSLVRVELKPGIQVPAHCSASGKLLMAFAPEQLRKRFLASAPFQAFTRSTITAAKALRRELDLIRRRGYSEDNEEFLPGVCCLAVPVRNSAKEVVAGLAVMAPKMSFSLVEARQHLAEIKACADAIAAQSAGGAMRLGSGLHGERSISAAVKSARTRIPRKAKLASVALRRRALPP
jgi:IclR family transcriptional regulator, acetate operon repressor